MEEEEGKKKGVKGRRMMERKTERVREKIEGGAEIGKRR